MENVLKRHVNLVALAIVLVAQILGLAYQITVKRGNQDSVRLIRVWTVGLVAPMEKAVVHTGNFFAGIWHNYFYLRSVANENVRLANENAHLRLEKVRLAEDAAQAQRLKALLRFKEQYVSETMPAQVIGGSGSELSRVVYIDKGTNDGIKPDMAVINPTGVVGKIIRVFPSTAQVLEINDQTSGIGAILETSRLQGILKGNPAGDAQLNYVMSDETVKSGERVLTSGGDHIFPRGLPIGTVSHAWPGSGLFLDIRVRPAANLNRLEEVLVITKISDRDVEAPSEGPKRAADILAQRLPSVPAKPPEQPVAVGQNAAAAGTAPVTGAATDAKPGTTPATTTPGTKPGTPAKPAASKPNVPAEVTTGASPSGMDITGPKPHSASMPASGSANKPATTAKPAQKKPVTPPSTNQKPPDTKPQTESTPQ